MADPQALHASVRATHDSRETGPRYWVTTEIDGKTVEFRKPLDDPFVRQTVNIRWRRWSWLPWPSVELTVSVTIGGDPQAVNDVMELDENALVPGRTRGAAFRQSIIGAALGVTTDGQNVGARRSATAPRRRR